MGNSINKTLRLINIFCGQERRYLSHEEFDKIMEGQVYITQTNNQFDETRKNYWSFELDNQDFYLEQKSIEKFYKQIIQARSNFIKRNYPELKMVFYTWYKEWQFHLSLTQVRWDKLPFEYTAVNKVECLSHVIEDFVEDPYKFNIIPFEALTEITEDDDGEDFQDSINVWSTILPLI